MKELKKLAVILRALGITANVVSDTITCNEEVISDNSLMMVQIPICGQLIPFAVGSLNATKKN